MDTFGIIYNIMGKKQYKTKKKEKDNPICGDCLLSLNESKLSVEDYFYVSKHNPAAPSLDHSILSCSKCIEKESHEVVKPYYKKRGRPKKKD